MAVHERVPDDEGHAPGRPAAAAGRSQYAALPCDTVLRAVARVRVRVRCAVCVRFRMLLPTALANQVLGPTASYMDQARHLDRQLDTMQRIDAPQGYADADSRFRVRLPARCPPPLHETLNVTTRHDTRLRTAGPPAAEIGPGRASHLPGQVGQPRRLHAQAHEQQQQPRPRPQPVIAACVRARDISATDHPCVYFSGSHTCSLQMMAMCRAVGQVGSCFRRRGWW